MERHSLLDDENPTPTQERGNVFDDEFEVDDFDFDGVADGFRPNVDRDHAATDVDGGGGGGGGGGGASHHARQDTGPVAIEPVRRISAYYTANPRSPTWSRDSTRKSRASVDPFTSPEDDDLVDTSRDGESSLQFEPDHGVRRSVSTTSSRMYARTSSPRFGAGPSHPYGMYRQGVARTLSIATTTSTARPQPQHSFSQLEGPQHPYAMYPQGVGDDLDDEEEGEEEEEEEEGPVHVNPVPVGMPGVGQSYYTRRMGPDGEDQDIIGEDGHTEQLPPYTRYPEAGPEKMPLLMPTALHSRGPVHGTDPGMPLMHTNIQPQQTPPPPPPQSMTDESQLDRHASMSNVRLIPSNSDDSSIEKTKKGWKKKTWRERRKMKVCGMRLWFIWVFVGILLFVAGLLGGAIGGFVAGGKHALETSSLVPTPSYYDASPIASITSGPTPTGTWALNLGPPEETQSDCLPISDQRPAWDCNLAPNSALGLLVKELPNSNDCGAQVFYASSDPRILYGNQLSQMNPPMAPFHAVVDQDDRSNGPAFYFQQYYDKIVVVPQDALSVSSATNNKGKRTGSFHPDFSVPADWARQRQVANPGERPWFCIWNSTFLEGFIYIQGHASPPSSSSVAPTASPNSTTPAMYDHVTTPGADAASSSATAHAHLTTVVSGWLTTTYTVPAAPYPSWPHAMSDDEEHRMHEGYHDTAEGYHRHDERLASFIDSPNSAVNSDDPWSQLQAFPYVVKLEERRTPTPNNIQPYCQQYQILNNFQANWVPDDDTHGPIIVELTENDPNWNAYVSAGMASTSNSKRRGNVPGSCHCQWMSGEQ